MKAVSRRARLGAAIRERAPEAPGVYFLRDEKGETLYIGKAVNLRKRLLSHLHPTSREAGARHDRMIHATHGFACEIVPSELLALVREDELIKAHRPPFNVRQADYLEYKYLERTEDRFPRLRITDHAHEFGGRHVFGPYRDRFVAERLLLLLQRVFGIRSCASPDPTDRCVEFDLGHCPGPCRGSVGVDDYAPRIQDAEAFLRGDADVAESRIRGAMEEAAARMEFEKAQGLKEQLSFCRRFCERERFLTEFRERKLTVIEGERTHLFLRGRRAVGSDPPRSAASDPTASVDPSADRRFVHDRGVVVHGWLRRNRGTCRYWFDEVEDDPPGTMNPASE